MTVRVARLFHKIQSPEGPPWPGSPPAPYFRIPDGLGGLLTVLFPGWSAIRGTVLPTVETRRRSVTPSPDPRRPAPPQRRSTDHVDVTRMLVGQGQMGKVIAAKDWSRTPLGPIESWSPALRTTVSLALASTSPSHI